MKILNFGSLNIDEVYTVFHTVRPGETLASTHRERFAGGKGLNQSLALACAGAQVCHAGCVGKDGTFLMELLKENGVDTQHIRTVDVPTGRAVIQVETNGQNAILLFAGANAAIEKAHIDEVLDPLHAGDWMLLQNEITGLSYLMEKAKEKGVRVVLNPSPLTDSLLRLPLETVDCFLVNETEGAGLTGETEPDAILRLLRQRFPKAKLVLTLGADGVRYDDGSRVWSHAAFPTRVADTTAAGDTFTGYFLEALLRGMPADLCLRRACAASALAVSRKGAAASIPMAAEVETYLQQVR